MTRSPKKDWEEFLKSYDEEKNYWGKAPEWLKEIIATEQRILKILREK